MQSYFLIRGIFGCLSQADFTEKVLKRGCFFSLLTTYIHEYMYTYLHEYVGK